MMDFTIQKFKTKLFVDCRVILSLKKIKVRLSYIIYRQA